MEENLSTSYNASTTSLAALDGEISGLPRQPISTSAERLNRLIATIKIVAQSLELAEILPEIVQDASQLLNAESGDILLWDRQHNVLKVVAVYNFPADMLNFEMPMGEGLSSQAMASRCPVMVPDYLAYPRRVRALDHYRFKAVLSVPLIARGEALGAINVHADRIGYTYAEDDINLLAAFADHAAVAIDNAQRYENEKRMVADLRSLNDVIQKQNEGLSQSLSIQGQFTQQALHGRGLSGLAQMLAALVRRPTVIEDPFFRLLVSADAAGQACPDCATPSALHHQPQFRAALAELAQTRQPKVIAQNPRRLIAPLLAADDVLGYLTLVLDAAPLSDVDQVAVELAATNCALELLKQRAAFEAEARLRGDFVLDLISGNFRDAESALARGSFLGNNLNHPFEVAVFDHRLPHATERDTANLRRRIFETAHRFLARKSPQSLIAAQSDALIVLLSRAPAAAGGIGDAPARQTAAALLRELSEAFPQAVLSAAIGESCRAPGDFKRGYEAARSALDLMKSLGKSGELIESAALGFYGLLLQSNAPEKLGAYARRTLQPLRDYDQRHHTELVRTLQLYFQHGGHKQRAAEAAFLHVNTLTYRLRRAQEVLGVDLRSPDDLLQIQFAFKVLDTIKVWD
jgi:sugar diacid utilization regulator